MLGAFHSLLPSSRRATLEGQLPAVAEGRGMEETEKKARLKGDRSQSVPQEAIPLA